MAISRDYWAKNQQLCEEYLSIAIELLQIQNKPEGGAFCLLNIASNTEVCNHPKKSHSPTCEVCFRALLLLSICHDFNYEMPKDAEYSTQNYNFIRKKHLRLQPFEATTQEIQKFYPGLQRVLTAEEKLTIILSRLNMTLDFQPTAKICERLIEIYNYYRSHHQGEIFREVKIVFEIFQKAFLRAAFIKEGNVLKSTDAEKTKRKDIITKINAFDLKFSQLFAAELKSQKIREDAQIKAETKKRKKQEIREQKTVLQKKKEKPKKQMAYLRPLKNACISLTTSCVNSVSAGLRFTLASPSLLASAVASCFKRKKPTSETIPKKETLEVKLSVQPKEQLKKLRKKKVKIVVLPSGDEQSSGNIELSLAPNEEFKTQAQEYDYSADSLGIELGLTETKNDKGIDQDIDSDPDEDVFYEAFSEEQDVILSLSKPAETKNDSFFQVEQKDFPISYLQNLEENYLFRDQDDETKAEEKKDVTSALTKETLAPKPVESKRIPHEAPIATSSTSLQPATQKESLATVSTVQIEQAPVRTKLLTDVTLFLIPELKARGVTTGVLKPSANLPSDIIQIGLSLEKQGAELVFFVGGLAKRSQRGQQLFDFREQKKVYDIDIVTNATDSQIYKAHSQYSTLPVCAEAKCKNINTTLVSRIPGKLFSFQTFKNEDHFHVQILQSKAFTEAKINNQNPLYRDALTRDKSDSALYIDTQNRMYAPHYKVAFTFNTNFIVTIHDDPVAAFTQDPIKMLRFLRSDFDMQLDPRALTAIKKLAHLLVYTDDGLKQIRPIDDLIVTNQYLNKIFSGQDAYFVFAKLNSFGVISKLFPLLHAALNDPSLHVKYPIQNYLGYFLTNINKQTKSVLRSIYVGFILFSHFEQIINLKPDQLNDEKVFKQIMFSFVIKNPLFRAAFNFNKQNVLSFFNDPVKNFRNHEINRLEKLKEVQLSAVSAAGAPTVLFYQPRVVYEPVLLTSAQASFFSAQQTNLVAVQSAAQSVVATQRF